MPRKQANYMNAKKERKAIDKSNFLANQKFCVDCDRPINQNCYHSNVMNGKCGSCFRINVREHKRRALNKTRDNQRKNQRKFKQVCQQY